MSKIFHITLLCLFACCSIWGQTQFSYDKFKSDEDFGFSSDGKIAKGKAILTPSKENRRGGIWYDASKMWVMDSFDTRFCFKIHEHKSRNHGGEGFAFVIHNNSIANKNGMKGTGLGYKSIPNSIAIEFDPHGSKDDVRGPHIALHSKGVNPNRSDSTGIVADTLLRTDILDGRVHQARISYKMPEIRVYIDDLTTPVFTALIDIDSRINTDEGRAWVGLTAATSKENYSQHEISCWEMNAIEHEQPKVVGDREVKISKKIVVTSEKLRIKVWDINQQDGDTVSVNLNGKWVINRHYLTNEGTFFEVEIEGPQNFLILHAHNLGEIPPNTAGIAVYDRKGKQTAVLRSNMQVSDALLLEYKIPLPDE